MNHVYRLIVSRITGALIVVAETVRGRSKNKSKTGGVVNNCPPSYQAFYIKPLCVMVALIVSGQAYALPQNGVVQSGAGTISSTTNAMTINQASSRLSINWDSFNIGANQSVQFNQRASDVALNRVISTDATQIFGRLTATGQVFILNPNGILFGAGAQVNVGGLVASTARLSDADFQAGRYNFTGADKFVSNFGNLTAADNGYIALLAPDVQNTGVISARLGTVLMAAGDKVNLEINNGSLLSFQVEQGAINALVDNKNLVQADGGRVFMSANAADGIAKAVVNNSGVVQARTIENHNGVIRLMADMVEATDSNGTRHVVGDAGKGQVNLSGTLDASAPTGGDGGMIETSATKVKIADTVRVTTKSRDGKTGEWLIDPNDFSVGISGDISGETLSSNLDGGNINIASGDGSAGDGGDVFVNSVVSWSANKLTLRAYRNIEINNVLNVGAGGQLALWFNQGGQGGTINFWPWIRINLPAGQNYFTKNASDPEITYTVITSLGTSDSNSGLDLQGIRGALSGHYVLGADIDASSTASWGLGSGFTPITESSSGFSGVFDGMGHTIDSLHINSSDDMIAVGLFGRIEAGAVVKNVALANVSITGINGVGGLAGSNAGDITRTYVTGTVVGNYSVGGLVGVNESSIMDSHAIVNVSGHDEVGGLVGRQFYGMIGSSQTGTSTLTYAQGDVTGSNRVGGLVGYVFGPSTITNTRAAGNVTGVGNVGGLIGAAGANISNEPMFATIADSYATGDVKAIFLTAEDGNNVGGLIGWNDYSTLDNVYASGSVSGGNYVGGLVGYKRYGAVSRSHASGNVSGVDSVGGLIGYGELSFVSDSYFDSVSGVTGRDYVGGLMGVNSAEITISGCYVLGSMLTQVTGVDFVGGLIGSNGGVVTNSQAQVNVYGDQHVGGLVGSNLGTVTNSQAQGNVSGNYFVGGLVGSNGLSIVDSFASGNVSGRELIGGLVGFNLGLITVSGTATTTYALGDVYGQKKVGGLVGLNDGDLLFGPSTIYGAYASGVVSGVSLVGGLVGENAKTQWGASTIINSFAKGAVFGDDSAVGGLVGSNDGGISNSSATLNVFASGNSVGGLVGKNTNVIESSYTVANVTGNDFVGGLVGLNDAGGTITGSYAIFFDKVGAVSGHDAVGGLVGKNASNITDSYAGVAVTGNVAVGGLVGVSGDDNNSIAGIFGSYATGNVSGYRNVGGLIGHNDYSSSAQVVFATGDVTGENKVGGLVGENHGQILYAYATNNVAVLGSGEDAIAGGLAAYNTGALAMSYAHSTVRGLVVGGLVGRGNVATNVYWDQEFSGAELAVAERYGSVSNVSLNSTQMTHLANFTQFDLPGSPGISNVGNVDTVWRIYEGHTMPLLRHFLTVFDAGDASVVSYDKQLHDGPDPKHTLTFNKASGLNAGVYKAYSDQLGYDIVGGDLTINQAVVTLSANVATRTYDATATATGSAVLQSGTIFAGDSIISSVFSFDDKNAGTRKTIIATSVVGDDLATQNYNIQFLENTTGTITQAFITLDGSITSRTYDATLTASSATLSMGTIFDGDTLVGGVFNFNDKNVGTAKTIFGSGAVISDGIFENNYNIVYITSTAGTITQAHVTLQSNAAVRTYNATTVADATASAFVGTVFAGDSIVGGIFTYNDKNVGIGRTISSDGVTITDGSVDNNYNISYVSNTAGAITQAHVTLQSNAAVRTYNATTVVDGTLSRFVGTVFAGDSIVGGAFAYNDKNVGTSKTIISSGAAIGDSFTSENYNISYINNTAGTITQAFVTLQSNAVTSVYNATTAAAGTASRFAGTVFAGDSIVGGAFAYNDKNVGTGKVITSSSVTITDGDAENNYNISYVTNTAGVITQADVTLQSNAAVDTYNATTVASGVASAFVGTVFAGDSIVGGIFTYNNKNVGTNKTITSSGAVISDGSISGNYNISYVTNTTGTINQAYVTLQSNAVVRTYDATTVADGTASKFAGTVFAGDSIIGGIFTYNDKNAGTTKTITSRGALIGDGADSGNYNISYVDNTIATITQAYVTLQSNAAARTYNATTVADAIASKFAGTLFFGDSIVGGVFAYNDKNVGTNKTIISSGVVISDGSANANYNISYVTNTTGTISQAYVVLQSNAAERTYDATTVAGGVASSFAGTIFSGDSIVGGVFAYNDKNAGTNKTITSSGAVISDGRESDNYNISYVTNTTGTISQAFVVLQSNAVERTYDATTVADGTASIFSGIIFSGDSIVGGVFAYNDKNAGTDKTITSSGVVIGDGSTSTNYNISYIANTVGTISKAALSITAQDAFKLYDQLPYSGGSVVYRGFIGGDTESELSGTLQFRGTSQGAIRVGNYEIIAFGRASTNYNITYYDGMLFIAPNTASEAIRQSYGESAAAAYNDAVRTATNPTSASNSPSSPALPAPALPAPALPASSSNESTTLGPNSSTTSISGVPTFAATSEGSSVVRIGDLFVIGGGVQAPRNSSSLDFGDVNRPSTLPPASASAPPQTSGGMTAGTTTEAASSEESPAAPSTPSSP